MIAIYCRKSIYSDKSDSVKNQEQMCLDFIKLRFPDAETITYTDEGFTGANTTRPNLNRLIADIRAEKVNALVVYQLDRLSRSVRDFAEIYDLLEKHKVSFLSVKENLDTSSPMGKAMMYITTVFAQMERETIAQRVTDNMQGLAKQGWWTGGNPPVGFRREKITVDEKKHTTIVPDQTDYVRKIYQDFLQNNWSLQNMETVYKHLGIKTHTGAFFSSSQLHKILSCPYYVQATSEVYDYYTSLGCIMADSRTEWNGSSAVMVYGRTTERNKKHTTTPASEWIVCKGKHDYIIDAETWLNAQKRFKKNTFCKQGKYPPPLLKGVLKCKSCGCTMQVSRKHYGDKLLSYYYCKTRSRSGQCTMSQIRCDKLDSLVLDAFKQIAIDDSVIDKYTMIRKDSAEDIKQIEKQILQKEKKINNLVSALEEATPSAQKRLISVLNSLDKEIIELNRKLENCRSERGLQTDYATEKRKKSQAIKDMIQNLDKLPPEQLNQLARSVILECSFDGKELFLRL